MIIIDVDVSQKGAQLSSDPDNAGFDTDLDWLSPDQFSEDEATRLIAWYENTHSDKTVNLTKFVPFLIELRPAALKRYRHFVQVVHEWGQLPQIAIALLFLHLYMRIGNERGVFYEVIAARKWGATKREVLDVIEMTFLESGPFGANAVAELSWDYLRNWPEEDPREVDKPWPATWKPIEAVQRVDHAATLVESLEELYSTYRNTGQKLPIHVEFLARQAPPVLLALRSRYVHAFEGTSLPLQFVPLVYLHGAVATGAAPEAEIWARRAKSAGVTNRQALAAISFGFLYTDEYTMDAMANALNAVFEDWN